jgi:hypothetical protein
VEYFRPVNIPLIDLTQYFHLLDFNSRVCTQVPLDAVPEELVQLLENRNLTATWVTLFVTPPRQILPPHIDGKPGPEWAKLNYVHNWQGTRMIWYHIKHGALPVRNGILQTGLPYTHYDSKDIRPIATYDMRGPTLVNPAVPHAVINSTPKHRVCLSLALSTKEKKALTLGEAASLLQS